MNAKLIIEQVSMVRLVYPVLLVLMQAMLSLSNGATGRMVLSQAPLILVTRVHAPFT